MATRSTTVLAAAALSLVVTPVFARGGGHGGGGHSSGGHFSGGHSSAPHYSAPHVSAPHYSAPHVSAAPHYAAPHAYGGSVGVHGASPMRAPAYYGGHHAYLGGGRGPYVAGGRVPAFYGGPRGGVWWGPRYGFRVPLYWGGYYRPYPAYWGLGYWVTDWIMLDYLAAEEARMLAYGGPSAIAVPVESTPLDVGVREELRAQVADYLAMPPPPAGAATPADGNTLVVNDPRVAGALAAPHHVFVVSQPVVVADRTHGGSCNLTAADLVRTSSPVPSGQSTTDVMVAASKKSSCPPGTTVALPIVDLVRFEEALIERVTKGAAAAKAADADADTTPAPSPAPVAPPSSFAPTAPTPPQGAPSAEDIMSSPIPPPPANGDGSLSL
jgi:hypothetical protein